MHQCLKCGRTVQSVGEIETGCPCGSKVFVFSRHPSSTPASPAPGPAKPAPAASATPAGGKPTLTLMPFKPKPAPPAEQKISVSKAAPANSPAPAPSHSTAQPQAPALPSSVVSSPPLQPAPSAVASAPIAQEDESEVMDEPYSEVWLSKGGKVEAAEPAGIENVRQMAKGVYEVDVRGLADGPMVVRDSEGVYYVRLPFAPLAGPEAEKGPK